MIDEGQGELQGKSHRRGRSCDVRVRVIARDQRFQNSAADSGPFSIVATLGCETPPPACGGEG